VSFALYVDNVLDTASEFVLSTTASAMSSLYGQTFIHLMLPLSAGTHVIKPMMKVVSGASGNVIARYTSTMRTTVKEI
jgi:hypothetical protein